MALSRPFNKTPAGPFIHRLLAKSGSESVKITAFVRSAEKALRTLPSDPRLTVLDGLDIDTHSGLDRIEVLSVQADFVFDSVSASHPNITKAALAGLAKRFKETGKLAKLIHISGTASFFTPAPDGVVDESKSWEFDVSLFSLGS